MASSSFSPSYILRLFPWFISFQRSFRSLLNFFLTVSSFLHSLIPNSTFIPFLLFLCIFILWCCVSYLICFYSFPAILFFFCFGFFVWYDISFSLFFPFRIFFSPPLYFIITFSLFSLSHFPSFFLSFTSFPNLFLPLFCPCLYY